MQVFNFLALIVSAAALAYFAFHRALIYLHILQQDEYNPERLILWIKQNSAFDKRGSTVCLSVIVAAVIFGGKIFFAFAGAVALSLLAFIQTDPRRLAKVPLKMTTRANKTFTVFCVFFLLIILLAINILKNYPGNLLLSGSHYHYTINSPIAFFGC
jgi:hypothetical protein